MPILRNLCQELGPDRRVLICELLLFDFLPLGSHVDADGHVLRGFGHEQAEAEATLVPSWLVYPYLV